MSASMWPVEDGAAAVWGAMSVRDLYRDLDAIPTHDAPDAESLMAALAPELYDAHGTLDPWVMLTGDEVQLVRERWETAPDNIRRVRLDWRRDWRDTWRGMVRVETLDAIPSVGVEVAR